MFFAWSEPEDGARLQTLVRSDVRSSKEIDLPVIPLRHDFDLSLSLGLDLVSSLPDNSDA